MSALAVMVGVALVLGGLLLRRSVRPIPVAGDGAARGRTARLNGTARGRLAGAPHSLGFGEGPNALAVALTPARPPRLIVLRSRSARIERLGAFVVPLVGYLVAAALLVFKYASYNGDAQARLANGYYVLFSRDPHLAAVGFVWNPLPSFSVMPLLLFKNIWPALATHAFAGNIVSAVFMAGAAYQLHGFLEDLDVAVASRVALTACFAFNPMVLYYGANGMSEALFLFTLLYAARYLARWLQDNRSQPLLAASAMLGVAYLARNEAVFAAALATLLVLAVTYHRTDGTRRQRSMASLTDGILCAAPFTASFVGWAVLSWIIVGAPFEQFSSIYGTSSQLRVINELSKTTLSASSRSTTALGAAELLAPLLPLVIVAAVLFVVRRRDLRALTVLAVPGGVLLFAILAYAAGETAGWFRYYITAVPVLVMLAGSLLAGTRGAIGPRRSPPAAARRGPAAPRPAGMNVMIVSLVALVAVVPSVFSSGWAMLYSGVGVEEEQHLSYIFTPIAPAPHGAVSQQSLALSVQDANRGMYRSVMGVTRALDAMHLPRGAIILDNFSPCVPFIVVGSKHPRQFRIPNDEDFQRSLEAPATFHVQYLFAPRAQGVGFANLDAVNRAYPGLYPAGGGVSTLVHSWTISNCGTYDLYRVNPASDE